MKSLRCDLVVVGLGPAGGAAARAAARAGLSVIAVDRRRAVGEPVQCAELVPLALGRDATREGVEVQRVAGMRTFLPSGTAHRMEAPGVMIDRAAFDRALAADAEAAGARLLTGTRVVALEPDGCRARLMGPDGEITVDCRLLVAADGPHSFVARRLGLPPLETVHTRQYTVPLGDSHCDTDIWLSPEYPGGYAWLFPKGRLANLGVGADRKRAPDLKDPLERLHLSLVAQGRVGPEVLARTGGAVPAGGLRERLVTGAILFAGDAAGLTNPVSGAGIHAAVASGEAAGTAAARWLAGESAAAADYEESIRDLFGPAIERALARRRLAHRGDPKGPGEPDAHYRRIWIGFREYFAGP